MEVQTPNLLNGEDVLWLKVYENIFVMVGFEKLDKSGPGLWAESVARSLRLILQKQGWLRDHL